MFALWKTCGATGRFCAIDVSMPIRPSCTASWTQQLWKRNTVSLRTPEQREGDEGSAFAKRRHEKECPIFCNAKGGKPRIKTGFGPRGHRCKTPPANTATACQPSGMLKAP